MVHLHVHSHFSLHDAIASIEDIIDVAKEQKAPAIAITDHGSAAGWYQFATYAKKRGIKPILGVEVYVIDDIYEKHHYSEITPLSPEDAEKQRKYSGKKNKERYMDKYGRPYYHLILLAQNEKGYENLLKLQAEAYKAKVELGTFKPRIDKRWLEKYNEGLIASSACLVGELSFFAAAGKEDELKHRLEFYKNVFGDRFFIEIMYHGIEREAIAIPKLLALSREYEVPFIITTDAHYARKSDATVHASVHNKEEEGEGDFFNNPEYYLKSDKEIIESLSKVMDIPLIKEGIKNTYLVADMVELDPYSDFHYILPGIPYADERLEEEVWAGLRKLYDVNDVEKWKEVEERAKYELEIIKSMGFSAYFLIVQDFIDAARKRNIIVGPGRGSAGGSIVAYALGITKVDPLKYDLIFERFLNPSRISMPDIDVDIEAARRDELYTYLQEKYGEDNVARIAAWGTRKLRRALEDAARAIKVDMDEKSARSFMYKVDAVKRMITNDSSYEELEQLLEQNSVPRRKELFELTKKIHGMVRDVSVHAAGVVVANAPIYKFSPVMRMSKFDVAITEFDKDDVEHVGLVKFDLLSLKNLTNIRRTAELIAERYDKTVEDVLNELDEAIKDPSDPKIFEIISNGDTDGLFQIESAVFTDFLKRLKPSKIEELVAALAINRPGPMQSGGVDMYLRRKWGEENWEEVTHPDLKDILAETYGVMVYQEQIMRIAQKIAGFTMAEADVLRKAIGKKKMDVLEAQKEKFIKGGLERGYKKDFLEELWAAIEKFGEYGFNKSHSAAYALVTYQTGYLKLHYPVEFYAALLERSLESTAKVIRILMKMKEKGIEVLPPSIRYSKFDEVVITDDNKVVLPFKIIKGIGVADREALQFIKARNPGNLTQLFNAIEEWNNNNPKKKLKKSKLTKLIMAGVFNEYGNPLELLDYFDNRRKTKRTSLVQSMLFSDEEMDDIEERKEYELTEEDLLEFEVETYGFFLQTRPFDPSLIIETATKYPVIPIEFIEHLPEGTPFATIGVPVGLSEKKGKLSFVFTDATDAIEGTVYNYTKRSLLPYEVNNQKLESEIAKHIFLLVGKKREDRISVWMLEMIGEMGKISPTLINNALGQVRADLSLAHSMYMKHSHNQTTPYEFVITPSDLASIDIVGFYSALNGEDFIEIKVGPYTVYKGTGNLKRIKELLEISAAK